MRKLMIALCVLGASIGTANAAWTVSDNDGFCWMRSVQGGTIVRVDMNPDQSAYVVVSSNNINIGNTIGARTMGFVNEGQYSSYRYQVSYTADQPGLVFFNIDERFLNAMARSETLVLFADTAEELSFGLSGSQSAVQKLRRCARNTVDGGDF